MQDNAPSHVAIGYYIIKEYNIQCIKKMAITYVIYINQQNNAAALDQWFPWNRD